MRRLPPAVWILAPLAIGLLYAAGHALLAPKPTAADLPPSDAILVQRFRNLDVFDRGSFGPRGPQVRPAREVLGDGRNVSGLPGVDHTGPLHMILMPRDLRQDSTMAVFRVTDREAFRRAFNRTDFTAQGRIRHAQQLVERGDWAAVGPNKEAARRIGGGGISARDLGEDIALAADVPRLVDHALQLAPHYPWRSILTALGTDVEAATVKANPQSGAPILVLPGDERLGRIRDTWQTARLWAWLDEGRLQVELTPRPGPLAVELAALSSAAPRAEGELPPTPPEGAVAWIQAPGSAERTLLAKVLLACGVRFVRGEQGDDALAGLGAAPAGKAGGLLLWAVRARGTGYALSIGLGARHGKLPNLSALLPLPAKGTISADLPAGAAAITLGSTGRKNPSPAGSVELRVDEAGYDLLTLGAGAKQAIEEMRAFQARGDRAAPKAAGALPQQGERILATFFLRRQRAASILARALRPGGFLAALADGDLSGRLVTDGTVLRLVVEASR